MTKTELKEQIRKIISEVLNEDYIPSTDPENILFDFYVLSYISSINLDVTSKGYSGGFIGKDPEELESLIADAEKKLLPYLKKEMLDVVFYSLGCEIRYVAPISPLTRGLDAPNPIINKYLKSIDRLFNKYGDVVDEKTSAGLISRIVGESDSNREMFVDGAGELFLMKDWSNYGGYGGVFGGKPWAYICAGWLRLHSATSRNDLYVAIDHIYDLHHNSGSVFDKVKKYLKDGDRAPFEWLTRALDLKANVKNIHLILPMASSDMRRIAQMVLKRANIIKP